jgi:hypothetical protein
LALLLDGNSGWRANAGESFVSPAYGSKQVAPMLQMSSNSNLPSECAVLLLAQRPISGIGTFASLGELSSGDGRGYCYQAAEASEFFFFSGDDQSWTCGQWSSDASFLYCKLENNRIMHVIMIAGSYGERRGKRFLSHRSRAEKFEWVRTPGTTESASDAIVQTIWS